MVVSAALLGASVFAGTGRAQEQSVNPGINDRFENPDIEVWLGRFERENRDVYRGRNEIVSRVGLRPGMDVADIGAGTGFFTVLFAQEIGPTGKAYAVDIADNFVTHVTKIASDLGLENVEGIVNTAESTMLAEDSIDVAFLCDTYHHFEYPRKMLDSIKRALRPDGVLVIVDFDRIEGVTREFIWNMVRAGRGTFKDEIANAGFQLVEEASFSDEQYILKFVQRR
jgi:ubiquinone/menaquinone biosynthesis C-methylase UbiE